MPNPCRTSAYLVERIMRYGSTLSITILQLLQRMRETSSNSLTWMCIQVSHLFSEVTTEDGIAIAK
jgi:hypothetical protein